MKAVIVAVALFAASGTVACDFEWRTPNVLSAVGHTPLSGQVEALAWIAGDWVGGGLGGDAEFRMAEPSAGTMAGTFKHTRDGEVVFYELIVIGEFNGRTAVRLKHFHPDLSGWEAQDAWMEFPLLHIEPGRTAYFDGLTWRLNDDGGLDAYVVTRDRSSGTEREFAFHYKRR